MAEYIEREAISEEIRKHYYKNPPNFSYGEGFDRGLDRAQRVILDAPAADVSPVRHGRWEDKPNPQWRAYDIRYCSACGWSIHKSKLRKADLNWAYCPNCGAKMEVKE